MDLCSRRIVGWSLADHMREELVIKALKQALKLRSPAKGMLVHSDRGGQYAGHAFRRLLQQYGLLQSMSKADDPYDNAFMEPCFSRFKAELLEDGVFEGLEDAQTEIFEYIEMYYKAQLSKQLDFITKFPYMFPSYKLIIVGPIFFSLIMLLLPDPEGAKPFYFTKVLYTFHLKGWTRNIWFDADKLPVIPRVGENIQIPFFKAYVGTENFYVAEIKHTLEDTSQLIDISLKMGRYNSYWHFRKDQAEEEGEISFSDYISLDDYSIKQKLNPRKHRHY